MRSSADDRFRSSEAIAATEEFVKNSATSEERMGDNSFEERGEVAPTQVAICSQYESVSGAIDIPTPKPSHVMTGGKGARLAYSTGGA